MSVWNLDDLVLLDDNNNKKVPDSVAKQPANKKKKVPTLRDPKKVNEEAVDEHAKKQHEKMAKSGEAAQGDAPGDTNGDVNGVPKSDAGAPGRGSGDTTEVPLRKPSKTWKQLVRQLVAAAKKTHIERNYKKTSRRGIAGITIMTPDTGAYVPPANSKVTSDVIKLALVIDVSGSMYSHVPAILSEVNSLLTAVGDVVYPVIKVSGGVSGSLIMPKRRLAAAATLNEIMAFAKSKSQQVPTNLKTEPIDQNVARFTTGGTEFDSKLTACAIELLNAGYNVLTISDADLAYGDNIKYIQSLTQKSPQRSFVIMADMSSYRQFVDKSKMISNNISVFDEQK